RRALRRPPGCGLVARKRAELEQGMASCAGLWLEAVSGKPSATGGEAVSVATAALVRTPAAVTLESVGVGETAHAGSRALAPNVSAVDTLSCTLRGDIPVTQPYWLRLPASPGLFRVADRSDLG